MPFTRRRFLAQSSLLTAAPTILPRTLHVQLGAPAGSPDAYAKPMPDLDGPFKPAWASIRDQHRTPALVQPRKIWQALSVAGGAVVLGVPGHVEHGRHRRQSHAQRLSHGRRQHPRHPAKSPALHRRQYRIPLNHHAKVERVTLLGANPAPVTFDQTAEALVTTLPQPPHPPECPTPSE